MRGEISPLFPFWRVVHRPDDANLINKQVFGFIFRETHGCVVSSLSRLSTLEANICSVKNFLKNFKKTLDKPFLLWYNEYRKREKGAKQNGNHNSKVRNNDD
jgi:hypothetical protein